ncbi:MAG: LysR family transcriptional regulator [Steroidobacteraceae bacterium]
MDTELARTFLVAVSTGSFVEAAQRLHVTQSTVSTRVQGLEETLRARSLPGRADRAVGGLAVAWLPIFASLAADVAVRA